MPSPWQVGSQSTYGWRPLRCRPVPKVAIWIIAASPVLLAVASLWLAGEMRYRNCLAREEARAEHGFDYGAFIGDVSTPGAGCSRLPF